MFKANFSIVLAASCLLLIVIGNNFLPKQDVVVSDEVINKTVESVFSPSFPEPAVEVIVTGDVMLGRTVMQKSIEMGNWSYPFERVAGLTENADIVFINLENPVVENCPSYSSGYKFCARPEMMEGLVASGIDIVTLANNHTGNYGKEGIESTVEYLDGVGIKYTGLGKLEIIQKRNIRFGFLGFDFVSNIPQDSDFDLVKNSDGEVDKLIVGVHWGQEYQGKHNQLQEQWAKALVDAGADVVVGHHPHWVQDFGYIDGKPVYYSLGNYIFDQMWSEETKKGAIVKLVYEDGDLVDDVLIRTYMNNWAQPEFVDN